MHTSLQVEEGRKKRRLQVGLATNRSQIREAQRLRWQVFAEEMGARLDSPEPGLDIDRYDAWCEHLIARDTATGEVVGTYRILGPNAAGELGHYYSDDEFDLSRLSHLRHRMVEVGRSCVHPDFRTGGTIALLWSGLADYMKHHGHDYLMGCASIGMQDGGHNAAGVWHAIRERHIAPPEWRVFPHCPLPLDALPQEAAPIIPPLVKGYLRAGAYVCGEPAWDPDFNTADLLVLLPMTKVSPAHARHFLGGRQG